MRTLKKRIREECIERRSRMSPFAREQAAANLAEWIYSSPFRLEYDVTVAVYVPVGSEPGSLAVLDALLDRGVTVLIPVVPAGDPGPLDWARYYGQDSLVRGRWGLWEPAGARLGTEAIRAASLILVPALAVDKSGVRLGRGGGYYDRTLTGLTADIVAVIFDDELVDSLPAGPYDVPVGWILTPNAGFRELG